MKVKVYKEGTKPAFPSNYKVTQRWEGVCANVISNNNKYFHMEVQLSSTGEARIFTTYGRVGRAQAKEYRYYPNEASCLKDYNALIKKKRDRKKDPYREVDLAITSIGSSGAQEIKKPMTGIEVKDKKITKSKLQPQVQSLVSKWFGSTGDFIEMTLKCPLGQLSKEQIDKGRVVLDDCKALVNKKIKDKKEYDLLTSQFYSLIPHVLPHKIQAETLRLNDIDRIMEKHDTLDTFLDAKNVESVMAKGTAVDVQYKKLNAELKWVAPDEMLYKWVEKMVFDTRARNHSWLGKMKIHNVYELSRDGENTNFIKRAEKIAGSRRSGKWTWPDQLKRLGPERPDDYDKKLYEAGNVVPLFHGTRNENMIGITTKGLLIRPSGATFQGAMYGSEIYNSSLFSKACNYSSARGTYWARGNSNTGYVFLMDVCMGDPKLVSYSSYYTTQNIKPHHSVWAKSGGGVINDEMIVYYPTGPKQQHQLRYIIEVETQAK